MGTPLAWLLASAGTPAPIGGNTSRRPPGKRATGTYNQGHAGAGAGRVPEGVCICMSPGVLSAPAHMAPVVIHPCREETFFMKHLLLSASLIGALVLAGCGKQDDTPAAASGDAAAVASAPAPASLPELRVAIDPTYEPFTYKTADGKPTGFDVDVAEALCAEIQRKCVFIEQVWDSMIPGLQAKKYDVIISSMSITDERKQVVDFTNKYYSTPSRIVVKKGTPYTDPSSLKGKKLGVLKGSTQEKYALGELKPTGAVIVPYEAQDQVYLDIRSGRLDGTVADQVEVTGGFLSKPEGQDYEFVGPPLNEHKYFGIGMGVALRKGEDDLREQLNAAIAAIRANGVYDTIAKKYFDFDIYGD
jgi:arginine/ornithine transport system substrate-binding protein